jgi:hypothetical protein
LKYIITHGDKEKGPDPELHILGIAQVAGLTVPEDVTNVIVGTGRRFIQTWDTVKKSKTLNVAVRYSPLCGSADSGEKSETSFMVTLADGTSVGIGDYVGLIGTPGVDLKSWLDSLPEGTLLVAGREFLGAIGYTEGKTGTLYKYSEGRIV